MIQDMSDELISRNEVIALLAKHPQLKNDVYELSPVAPKIICTVADGMVEKASANYPAEVYILDYDTECTDRSRCIDFGGEMAARIEAVVCRDPDYVEAILETPTLADDIDDDDDIWECPNCGNTDQDGGDECIDCQQPIGG